MKAASPDQLQSELNLAGGSHRGIDRTRSRIEPIVVLRGIGNRKDSGIGTRWPDDRQVIEGRREIRVIEDVEHLDPELDAEGLGYLLQRKILEE